MARLFQGGIEDIEIPRLQSFWLSCGQDCSVPIQGGLQSMARSAFPSFLQLRTLFRGRQRLGVSLRTPSHNKPQNYEATIPALCEKAVTFSLLCPEDADRGKVLRKMKGSKTAITPNVLSPGEASPQK